MNEQELIEQLKTLQAITPDPKFAKALRQTIFSYPKRRRIFFGFRENALAQSLNFGLSTALMALFILFVIGSVNGSIKAQLLTRVLGVEILNENALTGEHIDNQIAEVKELTSNAEKTNFALKEASTKIPGHINPLILEKEAGDLNYSDPTDKTIDDLLNKAI